MKKILILVAAFAIVFSSCTKEDATVDPMTLITGKWNGKMTFTAMSQDYKAVLNISQDLKYDLETFDMYNGTSTHKAKGTLTRSDKTLAGEINFTQGLSGSGNIVLKLSDDFKTLNGHLSQTANGPSDVGLTFTFSK